MFYQDVEPELFQKFAKLYCESAEFKKLILGEEKIPVAELWEPGRLFLVSVPVLPKHETVEEGSESGETVKMLLETVRYLPRCLIHIKSILYKEDEGFIYCFFLRTQEKKMQSLSMNEVTRLYDSLNPYWTDA